RRRERRRYVHRARRRRRAALARSPGAPAPVSYTIGIDVGGTFTDFVVADDSTQDLLPHKSASTPDDPSEGVLRGLEQIAERLGRTQADFLSDVPLIVHGTTVTTNAVLTDRGAKTGLLTTEG